MKLSDGFDGLDENTRIYAASANGDDNGYEGNGSFDDDDDEEEEVVVTMTSDDDDELDRLEEEAEEGVEVAIIEVAPPSPVQGYAPAAVMSKAPVKSAAPAAKPVKKAAKKTSHAKSAKASK